jgi:hypothetical protein
MNSKMIKTKYSYLSIKNPPTQKELQEYYSKRYYQNESIQFSHK